MPFPKFLENPRQRKILFGTAVSCATAGLGLYWYASRVEARNYKLEAVNIITGSHKDVPRLIEEERKGTLSTSNPTTLKILHLSDLHLNHPESYKVDFIKRVTDDDYDLIFITGDIFENYSGIRYASSLISRPPRLGTHAVLGNHDYLDYSMFNRIVGRLNPKYRHGKNRDMTPFVEALKAADINIMLNGSKTFEKDKVHIVGIDYPGISNPELRSLVNRAPGDDYLVLALFHIPILLDRFSDMGIHMAFGGHTHGGQVRLPGIGALITDSELPRHEASGLIWRGNTAIHISRGLGADPRTDFRLFCPPHASIINLRHQG